jgi:hypothetical protein
MASCTNTFLATFPIEGFQKVVSMLEESIIFYALDYCKENLPYDVDVSPLVS